MHPTRLSDVPISVGLFPTSPAPSVVELGELAERLGYESVYVGDSQLIWRELYALLGALAVKTSRIRLAAGVTNPVTRNWTVTAGALATLDELSGGRAFLGIGVGDSALRTQQQRPTTVADLEAAVHFARALYAGADAEYEGAPVRLGYRSAGNRLRVVLGANKPRMVQLAGRVADGMIWSSGQYLQYTSADVLENVRIGAAAAGRDVSAEGFRFIHWIPCCIDDDGQAARDAVRGQVARRLRSHVPPQLPPEAQATVERLRREYDWYEHMTSSSRHAELVPDSMVALYALAGSPRQCRELLEQLVATVPVDEIAIVPHGASQQAKAETMRLFAEQVMERTLPGGVRS
jgi:5,10-methylenetetrahydromethanopterin reductase